MQIANSLSYSDLIHSLQLSELIRFIATENGQKDKIGFHNCSFARLNDSTEKIWNDRVSGNSNRIFSVSNQNHPTFL